MDGFFGFVLFAVVAALTYEAPLFVAEVFGERVALVRWWSTVSASGDTARVIIFVAAYIVIGFTLWAAPLWYCVTLLRPEGGAVVRARTGAVLSVLLFPLLPLWERGVTYFEKKSAPLRERRELRALYRREFRDKFSSFEAFMEFYRNPDGASYSGAEQAPPPPNDFDRLKDAEQLLGLESGYTAGDLKAQYRALMLQLHSDVAPRSDIAQRINNARDTILAAKGWKR